MLKLYYTGAAKFERIQTNPLTSLGGYISSTEIPNGRLGNLFGSLSRLTVQQGRSEIRVFAIKNIDSVNKTGLKCWFTYPNDGGDPAEDTNDCEFEIGVVSPFPDDCGDLMTEVLQDIYSLPYSVELKPNVTSEATALSLGTLDAGDYLCIFVRRKIKPSAQSSPSDEQLLAALEGEITIPKVEEISLTFAWD